MNILYLPLVTSFQWLCKGDSVEVPICVIWICLLYIVLQLHQSFLLKLLYLPAAIQTWMICQHNTNGILAVYLE